MDRLLSLPAAHKEAYLCGAGEGYLVDLWMGGNRCAHCGPKAWHNVHHTRREPDLGGTETVSKNQTDSSTYYKPICRGGQEL